MPKAIVLISNGLDSLLTVKLMQTTNIEIKAVHFDIGLTYNKPIKAGQRISKYFGLEYIIKNGIEIDKFDIAKEFYSSLMSNQGFNYPNFCLEYRIFILKKAHQYMLDQNADFIVTGDVLDQKTCIQSKENLLLGDKLAEISGLVFRPLSALQLPELEIIKTYPQLKKIMYDFKEFSSKRQELASVLGITEYPSTQNNKNDLALDMGEKAFEIFEKDYDLNISHLNRLGIHISLNENITCIIGRTPFESIYLKHFYEKLAPAEGSAFSTLQPRFLFGFVYGKNISESLESYASHIFSSIVDPLNKENIINFFDQGGQPLGSKSVKTISLESYSQYLTKNNDMFCPIILNR